MIGYCKIHGLYSGTLECLECPNTEPLFSMVDTIISGQDYGRYHDYSTMVGLSVHEHYAAILGTKIWPHVNYDIVVRETIDIYHAIGSRMHAIDASDTMVEPIRTQLNLGGVVTEDVKFGAVMEYANPQGEVEHAGVKQAMVEYARLCLQKEYLRLPDWGDSANTDELLQQLREQEIADAKHTSETIRVRYRHPEGRHDDLAWAFLMALYVARPFITGNGLFIVRGNP